MGLACASNFLLRLKMIVQRKPATQALQSYLTIAYIRKRQFEIRLNLHGKMRTDGLFKSDGKVADSKEMFVYIIE